MKKTMIAALASLMLAGAISAASGAATNTAIGPVVVIGEGASPIPSLPLSEAAGDGWSNNQK